MTANATITPAEQKKLMKEFIAACFELFYTKNEAYARTDITNNAIDNFVDGAAEAGIEIDRYWSVLFNKHRTALATFIRTGKAPAPIHRIIRDMVNYLMILYSIYVVTGVVNHEEFVKDKDDD